MKQVSLKYISLFLFLIFLFSCKKHSHLNFMTEVNGVLMDKTPITDFGWYEMLSNSKIEFKNSEKLELMPSQDVYIKLNRYEDFKLIDPNTKESRIGKMKLPVVGLTFQSVKYFTKWRENAINMNASKNKIILRLPLNEEVEMFLNKTNLKGYSYWLEDGSIYDEDCKLCPTTFFHIIQN